MTPLDDAARERAASSLHYVSWVLNKWFSAYLYRHWEDLYGEGLVALCVAARNYDPDKAKWSTYVVQSIRWKASRFVDALQRWSREGGPLHEDEGGHNGEHDRKRERLPRDFAAARMIPPAPTWHCVECHRDIDWTANVAAVSARASKKYGLCNPCQCALTRAKGLGQGEGVCARCARVLRRNEARCGCYPEPPSLTPEASDRLPPREFGAERAAQEEARRKLDETRARATRIREGVRGRITSCGNRAWLLDGEPTSRLALKEHFAVNYYFVDLMMRDAEADA